MDKEFPKIKLHDLIVDTKLLNEFKCQTCKGLLLDLNNFEAKQCRDGCIQCISCWNKHLVEKKNITCFNCKTGIDLKNVLSRNKFLEDQFKNKDCYCQNIYKNGTLERDERYGCREVIKIGEVNDHIKECKFRFIDCPFNDDKMKCKIKVRFNQLEKHRLSCENDSARSSEIEDLKTANKQQQLIISDLEKELELLKSQFKLFVDKSKVVKPWEKTNKCFKRWIINGFSRQREKTTVLKSGRVSFASIGYHSMSFTFSLIPVCSAEIKKLTCYLLTDYHNEIFGNFSITLVNHLDPKNNIKLEIKDCVFNTQSKEKGYYMIESDKVTKENGWIDNSDNLIIEYGLEFYTQENNEISNTYYN